MSLLKSVKIFLLISLVFGCTKTADREEIAARKSAVARSWKIKPLFECGIYDMRGKLVLSNNTFTLVLRDKTLAPIEFILLGGDIEERPGRVDSRVNIRVYLPEVVIDRTRPYAYVKKYLKADRTALAYKLIQKEECNLN